MTTRHVWLDQRAVRQPVTKYVMNGTLNGRTVLAISTIGHEAAHLRGVKNERAAMCAGAKFAYGYLRDTGAFRDYSASRIKSVLLNDSGRPAAYKLNGTCPIGKAAPSDGFKLPDWDVDDVLYADNPIHLDPPPKF